MEDGLKIWDELLKTVQALTTWPLIVFYLMLLFRRELVREIHPLFRKLEALLGRLTTLKIGELEAGFQAFAATASPQLAQEVARKLNEAPEATVRSQPVDEQTAAFVTRQSFATAGAGTEQLIADQKTVTEALGSGEFLWRTHERLLVLTGLTPERLDAALTSLLQQDAVRTAFSGSRNVIFGLRERVREK